MLSLIYDKLWRSATRDKVSNITYVYTSKINMDYVNGSVRPRLHYTFFIRKRHGSVLFWPTVYIEPLSYLASNDDYRKGIYHSVYTMPFSYENVSINLSYPINTVHSRNDSTLPCSYL